MVDHGGYDGPAEMQYDRLSAGTEDMKLTIISNGGYMLAACSASDMQRQMENSLT